MIAIVEYGMVCNTLFASGYDKNII